MRPTACRFWVVITSYSIHYTKLYEIKSKMEVAKFFAGFISVVFGIVLKDNIGTLIAASSDSEHKIVLVGFTFSEYQIALWGFTLLLISAGA